MAGDFHVSRLHEKTVPDKPEEKDENERGDKADESRPQFAFSVCFPPLNLEIENADTESRLALINAAVACADHHPVPGFLFAAKINHRVRNRRIALDGISSGPEKQVARLQIFQFE